MTQEKQNIDEDYYAGNYKELKAVIYQQTTPPLTTAMPLTNCEVVWALHDEKTDDVYLEKSSLDANEIVITDEANGRVSVYLQPSDSFDLSGTYRHQMLVADANGHPETVLTGRIKIFKSYARRYREDSASAFVEGG